MCGIIGIVSKQNVTEMLLHGLNKLEYRGYDSSGIAVINKKIQYHKIKGKVARLQETIDKQVINGELGIGHTRWATHGNPNIINAHPHITDKVAVVHNGIIENVAELETLLQREHNISCQTETDTEIIPLLITVYLEKSLSPLEATFKVIKLLKGSFTFVALFDEDKSIIAVKKGPPLLIEHAENGDIITCSDPRALSSVTNHILYLEDYDVAYIQYNKVLIYNQEQNLVKRDILTISNNYSSSSIMGIYPNFMLKEMFDQPRAIIDTCNNFSCNGKIVASKVNDKITIIACGSSYFAALIGKYWLESIGGLTVQLEIASEFIYQNYKRPKTILFISQSGETADILAGLQRVKSEGSYTIGLTNTRGSTLARIADEVLYTEAGDEIGVASTKTFTTQLVVLQCLSIAQRQNKIQEYIQNIILLSQHIKNFLTHHDELYKAIDLVLQAKSIMYIGRGTSYGLAMEGALKLKELSYISAEGLAAGELKHGTLALIDKQVVTIAIIPYNNLFYKTFSNIQEIVVRGGKVIALSDEKGETLLSKICELVVRMPTIDDLYSPILYTIPIQLIAYYTSLKVGNNVDQPRNLAKSVTVE